MHFCLRRSSFGASGESGCVSTYCFQCASACRSCTLIGSSTNLLVSYLAERAGYSALGMFEMTRMGLCLFAAGLLYFLLAGRWLLPARRGAELTETYQLGQYVTELRVLDGSALIGETVLTSKLGARHDVTVLEILREKQKLFSPLNEPIRAHDVLLVRGQVRDLMDLKAAAGLELDPAFRLRDAALQAGDLRLVEVLVACQEYDPFQPWKKREPAWRRGYGVFVGPARVVTTESLVRNHGLVELRRPRTGEKIAAEVEMSDPQVNLACLAVRPGPLTAGIQPMALADNLAPSGRIAILQFDETSQTQRGEGQVYQVSVAPLPRAPYSALSFSLLTDFNVNGEGAAVVRDGALAGLMMTYNWNTRTGNMLPADLIRRFIEDLDHPPYVGFAAAGFRWRSLVDPVKRRYFRVAQRSGGVQVLSVLPGSGAAAALRPNDVIVNWDGRDIDNLGFYDDPVFGRLNFAYLIMGYRRPGDAVPVRLVRNGEELTVTVPLTRYAEDSALVPENVAGEQAEYLVEGGLILRELDAAYLRAHGADWQKEADSRLVHAYLTRRHTSAEPGERIVILAGVLPDPVNVAYQRFRDEVVTHVNGRPVRNMRDVFAVADADGGLRRIRLQSVDVDLVLDPAEMAAANRRLSEAYRIPALRYQRPASSSRESPR